MLTYIFQYKVSKYSSSSLTAAVTNCNVKVFTVEVSTLGFSLDMSDFCKVCLLNKLPTSVKCLIVNAAVSNSYYIYCNRNNAVENWFQSGHSLWCTKSSFGVWAFSDRTLCIDQCCLALLYYCEGLTILLDCVMLIDNKTRDFHIKLSKLKFLTALCL